MSTTRPGRLIAAAVIFCRKYRIAFWNMADLFAPAVPWVHLRRIGNFINGELWGRATTVPWGMYFPSMEAACSGTLPIYEAFFEGVLLFAVLWVSGRRDTLRDFFSLYVARLRPRPVLHRVLQEPVRSSGLSSGASVWGRS